MAVKSIDIIKSYLTEGKYPTASELVDVLDTLVSIGQNSDGDANVVDNTISSTSEHAVQSRVLYDELRITENNSPMLSIDGDYLPIVELDANEFEKIIATNGGGDIYIIPLLETSKAYSIKNSDGHFFDFSQSQVSSPLVFTKFDSNTFYFRLGDNHYWQLHNNFNGVWFKSYANITYEEEEGNHMVSITAAHTLQPNATETTNSVKSLKQKIAELEARIVALERSNS